MIRGRTFGDNFLSPRFCRADLGWFLYLVRRIFEESCQQPANFSANFDGEIFPQFSGLVFPRFIAPPPPQKFMPKTHAHNCRHSSPISLSRTQFLFHGDFLLIGEIKIFDCENSIIWYSQWRSDTKVLSLQESIQLPEDIVCTNSQDSWES